MGYDCPRQANNVLWYVRPCLTSVTSKESVQGIFSSYCVVSEIVKGYDRSFKKSVDKKVNSEFLWSTPFLRHDCTFFFESFPLSKTDVSQCLSHICYGQRLGFRRLRVGFRKGQVGLFRTRRELRRFLVLRCSTRRDPLDEKCPPSHPSSPSVVPIQKSVRTTCLFAMTMFLSPSVSI